MLNFCFKILPILLIHMVGEWLCQLIKWRNLPLKVVKSEIVLILPPCKYSLQVFNTIRTLLALNAYWNFIFTFTFTFIFIFTFTFLLSYLSNNLSFVSSGIFSSSTDQCDVYFMRLTGADNSWPIDDQKPVRWHTLNGQWAEVLLDHEKISISKSTVHAFIHWVREGINVCLTTCHGWELTVMEGEMMLVSTISNFSGKPNRFVHIIPDLLDMAANVQVAGFSFQLQLTHYFYSCFCFFLVFFSGGKANLRLNIPMGSLLLIIHVKLHSSHLVEIGINCNPVWDWPLSFFFLSFFFLYFFLSFFYVNSVFLSSSFINFFFLLISVFLSFFLKTFIRYIF